MEDFRTQSRAFCIMADLPTEQVNQSVDLWNASLKKPFFWVRQQLKDITLDNLKSVADAKVVSAMTLSPDNIDESAYYLFMDDDDWVSPNIVAALPSKLLNNNVGVVWGSMAFGTHRDHVVQLRPMNGFCYTNNYAVTGQALKSLMAKDISPIQHWQAETLIKDQLAPVNEYLSVTNKTPASTCYLMHVLQGKFDDSSMIQGAVIAYVDRCRRFESALPDEFEWAVPLMHRTLEVFEGL